MTAVIERLRVGDIFEFEKLSVLLNSLHYQRRERVLYPGDFSWRGGSLDVYPVTYRAPVRIRFEIDKIASIRDFSLHDGKSLASFDEVLLLPLTDQISSQSTRIRKQYEQFDPLTEHQDLRPGDFVVHLEYGIGKYLGTKSIQIKGQKKKRLAIEYAKKEILYIDPSEQLDRYIGGEGTAPKLTKLHTREWERVKERTRKAIKGVARDLLEIQALRKYRRGHAFPENPDWLKEFEAEFPFEETPDQLKAWSDIRSDMESTRPMDRLICGDVGYGKTEVAMRAAFKAVMGGKQAAFLVPTTVLAEQHYLVLKKRIENFPATVEVLSRFRSKKEQTGIVASLKRGATDIVIGTHRLLSRDIHFKDLGLVIIDEEQRFGVRHKEKLKRLKEMVDVLTLTATPIPRTLYMSLLGVRDMSVINTPPKSRLPIETYVLEYTPEKVVQAIEKELARGGQVYFVHNRVQSIEKIADQLHELMPHVKFQVAHGQMTARTLEVVMKDFMEKRTDCLVTTSIIESGIDIPNVNTIIVNRADQFGLSDLYQLRGRVGRFKGKRQAYSYFFVPRNWSLSQDAMKRLSAIERFTDLGSGFKIALEDLEIRGAGNLLGHEQSGFIHAVGFDLYCRMLKKIIEEMQTET